MLFSLKGPNQTLCYAYVCDLTFCVSLVERLGRLRVTVSELEASQGGCFPTVALIPPPHPSGARVLQYTASFKGSVRFVDEGIAFLRIPVYYC